MKKQIITLLATVCLSSSVFGQGQVTLANNAGSLIRFLDASAGAPVTAGSMTFQLMAGPAGSSEGSLTPLTPTTGVNTVAPGRIANAIVTVTQVAPGATGSFQILAFSSSFASYDAAVASGNPSAFVGKSEVFQSATSGSASPPPTPVSLAGRYAGFAVNPVPEPSTIALGILGAGSLLFLRRKK